MELIIFIFLVFLVYKVIKIYIRGRSSAYHTKLEMAKKEMAQCFNRGDKVIYPSWVSDEDDPPDDHKQSIFIDSVFRKMLRDGANPELLKGLGSDRKSELLALLFSIAAKMEKRGASFVEQQMAASEVGIMYLNKLISLYEDSLKS